MILSPDRHWSTWNAGRPAEIVNVPLGISLTPFAYAASIKTATWFPPSPNVILGEHAIDGKRVALTLGHAGTVLDWFYRKEGVSTLAGGWRAQKLGEWGARFWICLCVTSADGTIWRFDEAQGLLRATLGDTHLALAFRRAPLLVTAHDNPARLEEEFRTHGYWYLRSRATEGKFLALRFNLEEMPENRFAVAAASNPAEADRLAAEASLDLEKPAEEPATGPLSAIRDILGWNSVWDPVNSRPYTACSRNWDLEKFGGFGLWLTDTGLSALLHALFSMDQSWENLEALLAGQTEAGNFPCLLTGNDSWLDRSQPPLLSMIVWLIFERTASRELLERMYAPLAKNHQWWWSNRDGNRNAILEYGSSAVGGGLYIGTKLAAKDESFMDNSPVHDEAEWNSPSRTLDCEDVGLNSLMALDAEMLGLIAAALNRSAEAEDHRARAAAQRAVVGRHFWDAHRRIFANRLWNGKFVESLAPTSFFPLLAGAANVSQVRALQMHIRNPQMFGGKFGLPSVARKDPAFRDNVYWRGRIWPVLNWLVWLGLKRARLEAEAKILVRKSGTLFDMSWSNRLAPENFNAETGEGLDQPDTDSFYSWTALLPFMQVSRVIDFDPWNGWCLTNVGDAVSLEPMLTPAGPLSVRRAKGWIALYQDGSPVFETDLRGRLTRLALSADGVSFTLPQGVSERHTVRVAAHVVTATQNGRALPVKDEGGGSTITLDTTGGEPHQVDCKFAQAGSKRPP